MIAENGRNHVRGYLFAIFCLAIVALSTAFTAWIMESVVNEAFAEKFFPGEDPIGRMIGSGDQYTERIVGVVENVAEVRLTDEAEPARYYVYVQAPTYTPENQTLVIRTARPRDAEAVLGAARRTIGDGSSR